MICFLACGLMQISTTFDVFEVLLNFTTIQINFPWHTISINRKAMHGIVLNETARILIVPY